MTQITIIIPDDKENRILDAFCTVYKYKPEMGTKREFVKSVLIKFIKDTIITYEGRIASKTATDTVISDIDNIIIG